MSISDHLLQTLDARLGRYSELLKTCRQEFSEEAVHDLRVATRRLLALAELLNRLHSLPGYKKIRRMLKGSLDGFDELRDVQVMIKKVSTVRLPSLAFFLDAMGKREELLLEKAHEQIRKQKKETPVTWFAGAARALRKNPDPERISAELLQTVDLAYGRVLWRYDWMNKAQASSIHRLRIAFKQFRYLMEMIVPLIPGLPSGMLSDMHAYQTRLGDIQDMEVLLTGLSEFYGSGRKGASVRKHYQEEYARTIDIYWKGRGRVRKFWRPIPGGAFPWDSAPGINDGGVAE